MQLKNNLWYLRLGQRRGEDREWEAGGMDKRYEDGQGTHIAPTLWAPAPSLPYSKSDMLEGIQVREIVSKASAFSKISLNWQIITLQYCDGFCHRSTWIIHGYTFAPASPSILNPSPTSLPTLALWVVPEHQIWVPCFTHGTCAGHLFYIWDVHNAVLSNHPTLAFSHQVRKSLLYICVSFAALYVGSMVPSF